MTSSLTLSGLTAGWVVGAVLLNILWSLPSSAEPVDRRGRCLAWIFTTNGGFEGGEPAVLLECESPGHSIPDTPLQIICHTPESSSIRYISPQSGSESFLNQEISVSYRFSNQTITESARYEGAFGDWVLYKPISDPLITALAQDPVVDVISEALGTQERFPLTGSAQAISQLRQACTGE